MGKTIIATLCIASSAALLAQPTFERVYEGGIGYQFNLCELSSHNIFAVMGGSVLLDPNGTTLHANYYPVGAVLSVQSVKQKSDNEYYFVSGFHNGECTFNGMTGALIHVVLPKSWTVS